jgi:hypothetical protein
MVYVRPTDLPREKPPADPLDSDDELPRYIEPAGSLLPTEPLSEKILASALLQLEETELERGGQEERLGAGQKRGREVESRAHLSPGPVGGSPDFGAAQNQPQGFGSVMSDRAFDRTDFLRQQHPDSLPRGGVNWDPVTSVNGGLAGPLMVAEPIREGRVFVAQNVPRGPIRGSLMEPRRLQRVFSGVAQESGMVEVGDILLTSQALAHEEADGQVPAGRNGLAPPRFLGDANGLQLGVGSWGSPGHGRGITLERPRQGEVEGLEGDAVQDGKRLGDRPSTITSPPMGSVFGAAAADASREAAQVGAGTGGSGSGTTGATMGPLKRKSAAEEARRQKAKLELEASLETLRVYAASAVQEAVEDAAGGLEVLAGARKRKSSLRGWGLDVWLREGLDEGESFREGKRVKEGGGMAGCGPGVEMPEDANLGAGERNGLATDEAGFGKQEGEVGSLSPADQFAAAVARLERTIKSEPPEVSDLDLGLDDVLTRAGTEHETAELATSPMADLARGRQDAQGSLGRGSEIREGENARKMFEDLARRTLEALGVSPPRGCASNDAPGEVRRWEGSPPLSAQ